MRPKISIGASPLDDELINASAPAALLDRRKQLLLGGDILVNSFDDPVGVLNYFGDGPRAHQITQTSFHDRFGRAAERH
jgi:hypothetical protein